MPAAAAADTRRRSPISSNANANTSSNGLQRSVVFSAVPDVRYADSAPSETDDEAASARQSQSGVAPMDPGAMTPPAAVAAAASSEPRSREEALRVMRDRAAAMVARLQRLVAIPRTLPFESRTPAAVALATANRGHSSLSPSAAIQSPGAGSASVTPIGTPMYRQSQNGGSASGALNSSRLRMLSSKLVRLPPAARHRRGGSDADGDGAGGVGNGAALELSTDELEARTLLANSGIGRHPQVTSPEGRPTRGAPRGATGGARASNAAPQRGPGGRIAVPALKFSADALRRNAAFSDDDDAEPLDASVGAAPIARFQRSDGRAAAPGTPLPSARLRLGTGAEVVTSVPLVTVPPPSLGRTAPAQPTAPDLRNSVGPKPAASTAAAERPASPEREVRARARPSAVPLSPRSPRRTATSTNPSAASSPNKIGSTASARGQPGRDSPAETSLPPSVRGARSEPTTTRRGDVLESAAGPSKSGGSKSQRIVWPTLDRAAYPVVDANGHRLMWYLPPGPEDDDALERDAIVFTQHPGKTRGVAVATS